MSEPGIGSSSLRTRQRPWTLSFRAREWVDRSWIVIPAVYVVAALVLGKVVPTLDDDGGGPLGLELAPDSARDILGAVASGMIAFTGLVVSVALVVVQFGASQYTPRLVLRFRRDPAVKHALGIFIAPALFALVSLGDVGDDPGATANFTVGVAVLLLVCAVFAFFLLTARLLDLLRPRRLYSQLTAGCERAIAQVYPRPFAEAGAAGGAEGAPRPADTEPPAPITATIAYDGRDGVLCALDLPRLHELATAAGATLEVPWRVGEYVWRDSALVHVRGEANGGAGTLTPRDLQRATIVAEERTLTQDPAFAIRAIVDIAIRALSPAVNDPTTGVQGLDALESLLHRLARRQLGSGRVHDDDGRVRVIYHAPDWDDLVELSLTEIRHYGAGAGSHQIARRLRALLLALLDDVPAARRPALERQLELLDGAVAHGFPDPGERALASVADHAGLGAAHRPGGAAAARAAGASGAGGSVTP